MRLLAPFFALAAVAVACGGQVAPDSSGKSSSEQKADSADTNTNTNTDDSSANTSTGGSPGATGSGDSTVHPTTGPCFLPVGDPAPGECTVGDERDCPADAGAPSASSGWPGESCKQKCWNDDGKAEWSTPTTSFECPYYDTNLFIGQDNPACICNTPLVLAFDNERVAFRTDATGTFDLTHLGISHGSDWPAAATPWLALDRDGNGTIDDGGELFGSATRLATGGYAKNGFEALADLDANHDGVFDARDPAFAKVVVWSDRNHDRQSTKDELTSLADAGVTAIALGYTREPRCDARGNCEGERASFTFGAGKRGTVIDVYLPSR